MLCSFLQVNRHLFSLMVFTWFDHLLFAVIGIGMPIMAILSAQRMEATAEDEEMLANISKKDLYYTNGLMLWIAAMVITTAWQLSGKSYALLGITKPIYSKEVVIGTVTLLAIYLGDLLFNLYNYYKGKEDTTDKGIEMIAPTTWKEYGPYIFLALSAGICEEIIYRGFALNYLMNWYSTSLYQMYFAIIVSSIAFAVAHIYQGWVNVLKILIISFLFGYIFIMSKSLLLVSIIHIGVDMLSGVALVWVSKK